MFRRIICLAVPIAALLLLFEQTRLRKRIRHLEDKGNLKKELIAMLDEEILQEGDLSYDF